MEVLPNIYIDIHVPKHAYIHIHTYIRHACMLNVYILFILHHSSTDRVFVGFGDLN